MHSNRNFLIKAGLLFTGILIITLIRHYHAFVLPALYWEDGTRLFAFYTNNPAPLGVFRFYKGYTSLLPNLVGYLATFAPPPITPYIMGAYSMLLTGLAYTLFYLRRFRCMEENDGVRLSVCVFLILMPLGNFAIMSSAMQSLWHLLWILVMLAYAPLGSSVLGVTAQFVLLGFAIWSHPSSIFVVPLYIYNFFARPALRDRLFNGGLLLLTIGYYRYGIQLAAAPQENNWALLLHQSLACLLERVVFESLFGNRLRMLLNQQGLSQVIFLAAVIILIALGLLAFRRRTAFSGRDWRRMVGACILMITLTVTGFMRVGRAVVDDPWNQRYVYIQQLLFLIALIILLVRSIRWQNWPPRWRAGTGILIVMYITLLHWHIGGYFKSEAPEGRRVAQFLRTLDEKKDLPLHLKPSTLVLHKSPPKWSIRIRLKPPQSRH